MFNLLAIKKRFHNEEFLIGALSIWYEIILLGPYYVNGLNQKRPKMHPDMYDDTSAS